MQVVFKTSLVLFFLGCADWVIAQDSLVVGGSAEFQSTYFESSSDNSTRKPFTWRFNARPTFRYKGYRIDGLLNVGNFEDRLGQAFNKFGLTTNKKWVKVHLGHRNMHFSPLTLSGHLFFGAGVELTPGKLRLAAMYGQLQRPVDPDSTATRDTPAFRRLGYGAKIGVGRSSNYVDLIFFRAEDDSSSISYIPDYARTTPARNLVLGLSTKQRLFKRFYLQGDVAFSAYNRDNRSTAVDLGDDVYGATTLLNLFEPTYSSQYLYAYAIETEYRFKDHAIAVGTSFTEPDYQTMGTYFFQNDIQRFFANGRWTMLDKKLRFHSGLGYNHNNLRNDRSTRNNRTNINQSIHYNPDTKRSLSLNYSGFQNEQENTDSQAIITKSWTHAINVFSTIRQDNNRIWSLSGLFVTKSDQENSAADFNNYGLRGNCRIPINDQYSVTPELGAFLFDLGVVRTSRISSGANLSWTDNSKKLNMTVGTNYTLSFRENVDNNQALRSYLRSNWNMSNKHRLYLRVMHNWSLYGGVSAYAELRADFGYNWRF